eukprot:189888-Chlamydomonas_euryale.AAC.1
MKGLTEAEAKRLRGQLKAVEKEHRLVGLRQRNAAVDHEAPPPWRPNSALVDESHPERFARPGDHPTADLTFKPQTTKHKSENERTEFFAKAEAYFEKDRLLKEEIDTLAKEDAMNDRGEELRGGWRVMCRVAALCCLGKTAWKWGSLDAE